jgi:hypothetical protein
LAGSKPTLRRCRPSPFEKQSDLRRAAFDASESVEQRDRFVDRLRWMRPYLRCNAISVRLQHALWAMEVEAFQGFHATCMIQLEIRT